MYSDDSQLILNDITRQGFTAPEHNVIHSIITSHLYGDDLTRFWDYTMKPEDLPTMVRFDLAKKIHDKTGVTTDAMLRDLFNYAPKVNGKQIGKGERLLSICMKGNPDGGNDFVANQSRYEVKHNGRLRGQVGFDAVTASGMRKHLEQDFCAQANTYGIPVDSMFNLENSNSLNFYTQRGRKKRFFLPIACKLLLENAAKYNAELSVDWLCDTYITALSKYYTRMTDEDRAILKQELAEEFDGSGMKVPDRGYSMFVYKIAAYALRYYQYVEQFDYIVFFNDDLECLIMPATAIQDATLRELAVFIMQEFKIIPMGLGDKAGQGASFAFELKRDKRKDK